MVITKSEILRVKKYAKNHPEVDSDYYLCFNEELKHLNGGGWFVYDKNQQGYKTASEKYPYIEKRGKK